MEHYFSFRQVFLALAILAAVLLGASVISAWTGPSASPPNANVPAPVNVGTTDQVKDAGLGINALAVFGNAILSGANRYLNFGSTAGSSGYGFRDSGGTMQFKNSGGTWESFGTASGGSVWSTSGSTVYYNSGNVGIGTASPSQKLEVAGSVKSTGLCIGNECHTNWQSVNQPQTLVCQRYAQDFSGNSSQMSCPAGWRMTGGGGGCDRGSLRNSRPSGNNGWEMTCAEPGPRNRLEVVCCRLN